MKRTIKELFNYVKDKHNAGEAYKVLLALFHFYNDGEVDLAYDTFDTDALAIIVEEFANEEFEFNDKYVYSEEGKLGAINEFHYIKQDKPTLVLDSGEEYYESLVRANDEITKRIGEFHDVMNPYNVLFVESVSSEYSKCDLQSLIETMFGYNIPNRIIDFLNEERRTNESA